MASVDRPRFFRGCLALSLFTVAFIVGEYGVLLLLVAVDGRGSSGGSAVLFGLGLFFLILSQFIFNVGLINWRFANPCPENAEG
jgi:hypothetical protein